MDSRGRIPTVGILHTDDSFYDAIIAEFMQGDPTYRASAMVCVSQWQKTKFEKYACGRYGHLPYPLFHANSIRCKRAH